MARERSDLKNGLYNASPVTRPPISGEVIITVLQTTTGGTNMLEGGVSEAPVDLHTGVDTCGISEGDYLRIIGGQVVHKACRSCRSSNKCQITAVN